MDYVKVKVHKSGVVVFVALVVVATSALVLHARRQRVVSSNNYATCAEAHNQGRTKIKSTDQDYNVALDRKPFGEEC